MKINLSSPNSLNQIILPPMPIQFKNCLLHSILTSEINNENSCTFHLIKGIFIYALH